MVPQSAFRLGADIEPSASAENILYPQFCERLAHLVAGSKPGTTYGILGEWGRGKTFVIRQVFNHQVIRANYVTVEFDAWKYSSSVPLLTAILKKVQAQLGGKETDWRPLLKAAAQAVADVTGWIPAVGDIAERIEKRIESDLANIDQIDDCRELFERAVRKGLDERKRQTLLVFIDNLDRCLPDNALNLLEAMKHLLATDFCSFLVALDISVIDDALMHRGCPEHS